MTRRIRIAILFAATALLLLPVSLGAVTYAAGRINTTVLQVTGTKTELVQLLEPVLVTAGWTTISGTGTGDVVMESANPAGSVVAMRVRLFDTVATSMAISARNIAASNIGQNLFLLPAAAKTWRIIANEYQAFIFTANSTTTSRGFVAFGIPSTPAFLTPGELWWSQGDATSEGDATDRTTFRTRAGTWNGGATCVVGATLSSGNSGNNYNGTLLNITAGAAATRLWAPYDPSGGEAQSWATFADDSALVSDSYIGWGIAGLAGSPSRIVGTLYDAIVVSNNAGVDATITFNTFNFWVITVSQASPPTGCGQPGVLAVRVP